MKVTRGYAIELCQVLHNADKLFESPITGRFRYMASYNLKKVDEERRLTLEAYPFDPRYVEFEEKLEAIKREAGGPQKINQMSDVEKDQLEQRIIALEKEYEDALDAEREMSKGREEFLKEEIELELRTITPDDIPNIVAANHWQIWNLIEPLVKD